MLDKLAQIESPLQRVVIAATGLGSLVAMAAAVVLGVTGAQQPSAYQNALYASLGGASIGMVVGLTASKKRTLDRGLTADTQCLSATADSNWSHWRNFKVIRKVRESEEITSFYLQSEDSGPIPNFQPGQFLTIRLDIPGQPRPVIRTYSLSDYDLAIAPTYYRLSIKRELSPTGVDVPPGVASNFMHDHLQEGMMILAKPPSGRFVLDVSRSTPIVLISNGVGITPMIAMAKAAAQHNPQRRVWFFHGARDGRFHAFRDEIDTIAAKHSSLTVHYAYSKPQAEDEGRYQSKGYVDMSLIQSLLPSQERESAEFFLCGSPPFMDSLRRGLNAAGVPDSRVFFEMFTTGLKAMVSQPSPAVVPGVGNRMVVFSRSKQTVTWQNNATSLLEFAEANGLNPDYSCRSGICGTCECKILEGEVEYALPPTASVAQGSVLICISRPKTPNVVLDL